MSRRVAPRLPHHGPRPVALDADSARVRLSWLRWRLSHACPACDAAPGAPCASACRLSCAWHARLSLVLALDDTRDQE
jgi:hypothetical protein